MIIETAEQLSIRRNRELIEALNALRSLVICCEPCDGDPSRHAALLRAHAVLAAHGLDAPKEHSDDAPL